MKPHKSSEEAAPISPKGVLGTASALIACRCGKKWPYDPEKDAGKRMNCPKCGSEIRIPALNLGSDTEDRRTATASINELDVKIERSLKSLCIQATISTLLTIVACIYVGYYLFTGLSQSQSASKDDAAVLGYGLLLIPIIFSGIMFVAAQSLRSGRTEFTSSLGAFAALLALLSMGLLRATSGTDLFGPLRILGMIGLLTGAATIFMLAVYSEAKEQRTAVKASLAGESQGPAFTFSQAIPFVVSLMAFGWFGMLISDGWKLIITRNIGGVLGLLSISSVALMILGMLAFLRPRASWVLERSIQAFVFTSVVGVAILLSVIPCVTHLYISPPSDSQAMNLLEWLPRTIGYSYLIMSSSGGSAIEHLYANIMAPGFCEELTKMLPLLYFYGLTRRTSKDPISWLRGFLAVGFFSGLGFGITEAVAVYGPRNGNTFLAIQLVRWFSCVGAHAIWAMSDAAILLVFMEICDRKRVLNTALGWCLAFVFMGLFHGIYDFACNYQSTTPSAAPIVEAVSLCVMVYLVRRATKAAAFLHPNKEYVTEDQSSKWLNKLIDLQDKGVLQFGRVYTACLVLVGFAAFLIK